MTRDGTIIVNGKLLKKIQAVVNSIAAFVNETMSLFITNNKKRVENAFHLSHTDMKLFYTFVFSSFIKCLL